MAALPKEAVRRNWLSRNWGSWDGETVAVIAPGPTLDPIDVVRCRNIRRIAVTKAFQQCMTADLLYAADWRFWEVYQGVPEFTGQRLIAAAQYPADREGWGAELPKYGIEPIDGTQAHTFSMQPGLIHYGQNSGFQAVNIALQLGAARVLLLGFTLGLRGNARNYGEPYPKELQIGSPYTAFIKAFEQAAQAWQGPAEIVNCTAASALRGFRQSTVEAEL